MLALAGLLAFFFIAALGLGNLLILAILKLEEKQK